MALEDYTKEEIGVIDKFLGDRSVWRGMGQTRPANSFEEMRKTAERQKDFKSAVEDRCRRERELIAGLADENGRIAGKLPLTIQNACRRIVGEDAASASVYSNETVFTRYTDLLKLVCQEVGRW